MTTNIILSRSSAISILLWTLLGPGPTFGQEIFTDATLDVDFNADGECLLFVEFDEPYSAMNSACEMLELDGTNVIR